MITCWSEHLRAQVIAFEKNFVGFAVFVNHAGPAGHLSLALRIGIPDGDAVLTAGSYAMNTEADDSGSYYTWGGVLVGADP